MTPRKYISAALAAVLCICLTACSSKAPNDGTISDAESTWNKIEQEESTPTYVDDSDSTDMSGLSVPDDGTSGSLTEYQGTLVNSSGYAYTIGVVKAVSDSELSLTVYKINEGASLTTFDNVDLADYTETKDVATVNITSETAVYSCYDSGWRIAEASALAAGQTIALAENEDGTLDSIIIISAE